MSKKHAGRVRIVQLLCPSRHAIAAYAYESPRGEPLAAEMVRFRAGVQAALETGLAWRCELCRSETLVYEDARTRFDSLEEAGPYLRQLEAEQLESRTALLALRARGGAA
jgi:hypothetical protein